MVPSTGPLLYIGHLGHCCVQPGFAEERRMYQGEYDVCTMSARQSAVALVVQDSNSKRFEVVDCETKILLVTDAIAKW
jgi:hypothetical protein